MTNRQRYLLNANEYDLLVMIQEYCSNSDADCVIDAIMSKNGKVDKMKQCDEAGCEECIQKWLNEEDYCERV